MDDVILFEISGLERATELCKLLAKEWLAWVETRDDLRHVAVLLQHEEGGDLAALMRTVEAWVAERGMVAIWFVVDGRRYLLAAAPEIPQPVAA